MPKTVTIRFTNGSSKKVVLGIEQTCCVAEPRGWGTKCRYLVLLTDGLYRCADCGLVFKSLELKQESAKLTRACKCERVRNIVEWYFDDFFGYDCPISLYKCMTCKRIYHSPHYSREASIKKQESPVAIEHTRWVQKEHRKKKEQTLRQKVERRIAKLSMAQKQKILTQVGG